MEKDTLHYPHPQQLNLLNFEKMKTANEIFDAEFYFLSDFLNYQSTPPRLRDIVIGCMEKFAEQQKSPKWNLVSDGYPKFKKSKNGVIQASEMVLVMNDKGEIGMAWAKKYLTEFSKPAGTIIFENNCYVPANIIKWMPLTSISSL